MPAFRSIYRFSLIATVVNLTFCVQAQEQSVRYSGTVTDASGNPLNHARVHIHGRQQYIYADAQGRFSISAPANAELHVSAKGYGDSFVSLTPEQQNLLVQLLPGGVERIVISASGIHKNNLDMATPISVLTGEELSRRTEPTIGETLKNEPGVHANYYGPVASSPIIRGLDGPRVKVLSNGLDTGDVSRVGPDHTISADAITAEQIEVMRGPATLLYGSGAIGGVVNVVDNRIPRQLRDETETKIEARYSDVSSEQTLAVNHEGSQGHIAWHFDGYDRDTSDYAVPRFINDEGEVNTVLANSWLNSRAINAGLSYINDNGLLGLSIGRLESDYGIPGHHNHEEATMLTAEPEEAVFAQLRQNRTAISSEWYTPFSGIETLLVQAAYTDYQHQEIEDGNVGTTFKNQAVETRLSVEHLPIAGWHGLAGYHLQLADYQAIGEEAFTPDSKTTSHAIFTLEEKQFDTITVQLGARLEYSSMDAGNIKLDGLPPFDVVKNFTSTSASAGAVWEFIPGFSWALAYSRSERAPSAAELYSNGAHIATSSYEVGLLYQLTDDGDITFADGNIKKETANNLDLTFRRFSGDLTFTYNFFYNKVHNYLYQADLGLTLEDLTHDHADSTDNDAHFTDNAVPVYQYQQHDATLYGIEFEAKYQLDNAQSLQVFADMVRAKLDNAGYLPRIPPVKTGLNYQYQAIQWSADIGVTRYANQHKVAANESSTNGYTLLDANINYDFRLSDIDLTAFVRATNLTDELAFVHSSFIKDDAPLPGRAITMGLRATF
jgi:iron complex outermembrane recepter protein